MGYIYNIILIEVLLPSLISKPTFIFTLDEDK